MGWSNSNLPWTEFERRLSGREPILVDPVTIDYGDGSDTPAMSANASGTRRRRTLSAVSPLWTMSELHCHTNFSFLDGASQPEELVEEAVRLGLSGLAVTDHDGFYGVVRFADAARELDLPTVFGAELSLELPGPQNGEPDPVGRHLLVLARGPEGYARLSRTIALAQLAGGEKGRPGLRPGRGRRRRCATTWWC